MEELLTAALARKMDSVAASSRGAVLALELEEVLLAAVRKDNGQVNKHEYISTFRDILKPNLKGKKDATGVLRCHNDNLVRLITRTLTLAEP